jgi:pimeloyl-ACP methyl ester carboxylesterase
VVRRALEAMGIAIPEGFDVDGHELLDLLAEPGRQASRARWGADDLFLPFGAWNGAPRSAQRWHELLRSTTALAELNAPDGFDRAGLRAVGGPSLALYGELSRYLPTARVLQRDLPDCRIRLVPGVGHFHPMLKPGVFAQETSTFLREQGRT